MADELLRIADLSVRLGDREVLGSIDVSIPDGALLAVLGPNGSGKSTLLKTLLGLVQPHSGRITLGGQPIRDVGPGRIGYVPQIKSLDRTFPARAVELVASAHQGRWPGRLSDEARAVALEALGRVGAAHLAERSIGVLSGGELQRVYLARSVARRPSLILLDEPETGVDATGNADLHALVDRCRGDRGSAVILVTHDWEAAMHHATHVLLLRNRQVAFGSPAEAFTEDTVRAAFGHVGHAHAMFSFQGSAHA